MMIISSSSSLQSSAAGEYHSNLPPPKASYSLYPHDTNNVDNNVAITFVGISYSDNTTSDTAIDYLVDAACHYGIHSYILLGERDADMTLDKKIAALAHHYSGEASKRTAAHTKVEQHVTDGKRKKSEDYPKCMESIHVSTSPGEEEIYNIIQRQHQLQQSHNNSISFLLNSAQNQLVNNPLDKNNRIARIKRTREYQRQNLRDILEESSSSSNQHSAIAVLDLDLLAYPSLPHLIETVYKYIFFPSSSSPADTKYHAICANGLMTIMSKSQQRYVTRYYDTYSTILLPNAWLHRDRREVQRRKPISELTIDVDENEKLASMNQEQTYQYIMQQGIRSMPDELMSIIRDGKTTTTTTTQQQQSYVPVPVRSCFNGLTIYRTDVYLNSDCRYDTYNENDDRYASIHYKQTCEHVVLHECLRRKMMNVGRTEGDDGENGFRIAVMPDMKTLWHLV